MSEKEIIQEMTKIECHQFVPNKEEIQAVSNILDNLNGFNVNSAIRILRLCINTIWLSLLEDIRRRDKN